MSSLPNEASLPSPTGQPAQPTDLVWLPQRPHWRALLGAARSSAVLTLASLAQLANARLDTLQTMQLDRVLTHALRNGAQACTPVLRVALLGSSTLHYLVPSLRVAGLRRGLILDVYECIYGQYLQELLEPASPLTSFAPEIVLLAPDAHHLAQQTAAGGVEGALAHLGTCWRAARERFGAAVVQQTCMPVFTELVGSNEHHLASSSAWQIAALNTELRPASSAAGVSLLAVDQFIRWGGIDAWYSPGLWNHARQEVRPSAAPLWGDLAARVIAAQRGRSAKCLVLDLDNTLWGGVVGDDGPAALAIGQGSAAGEAHLSLQQLCLALRRRGILLAVCSKNDDAVARSAFTQRPEMPLALEHFASFHANWNDKASNLRLIAEQLRLGLDALVFLDDNPAERALVRQELPEVHVPELPADPALFAETLSRAGYFESVALTEADFARAGQYATDTARMAHQHDTTDMAGYLASLGMAMRARPFDERNLPRIVQLANKTNQFNLTTRRLSEEEVRRWMLDTARHTWQVDLSDRFGDHGTVALLSGVRSAPGDLTLDLWLMSCRVLGRELEQACLNLVTADLLATDIRRLVGVYRPSGRNGMVADLYSRLGFTRSDETPASAISSSPPAERWLLLLSDFAPLRTAITAESAISDSIPV